MFYCSTFPGNSTELGTVLTIKTPDFVTYTLAWSQICLKSGVRKFLSSEQPSLKIFFAMLKLCTTCLETWTNWLEKAEQLRDFWANNTYLRMRWVSLSLTSLFFFLWTSPLLFIHSVNSHWAYMVCPYSTVRLWWKGQKERHKLNKWTNN